METSGLPRGRKEGINRWLSIRKVLPGVPQNTNKHKWQNEGELDWTWFVIRRKLFIIWRKLITKIVNGEVLIAKLFWAPCLGEPPFGFPFHLFRLLSVNLSPICSVFVSNLIVIWKREGSPHLVSPLLVRCVFVATNLLDQMPRMEGKHHCASPLLFPSYISNFEQLEKERAVTIVWVFFWSDGDCSYTNENHFSALLSAIPHICHGCHGRRPCKFFLASVNFFRCNAKNWRFLQI